MSLYRFSFCFFKNCLFLSNNFSSFCSASSFASFSFYCCCSLSSFLCCSTFSFFF